MDNKRSVLSKRKVWNETRSRKKWRIQRKGKGFGDGIPWKRNSDRKDSFRKGKPANVLRLSERVIVLEGMPLITGTHPIVPFIKEGIANLGISVRSSIRGKTGSETKETK